MEVSCYFEPCRCTTSEGQEKVRVEGVRGDGRNLIEQLRDVRVAQILEEVLLAKGLELGLDLIRLDHSPRLCREPFRAI